DTVRTAQRGSYLRAHRCRTTTPLCSRRSTSPGTPPAGAEMKAPARLGLYGLVLAAVFAVAGFTANAVIPEETVQSWAEDTAQNTHHDEGDTMDAAGHEGDQTGDTAALGLGIAQDGYQLTAVAAPTETSTEGRLSLTIIGPDGNPVTDFELEHEKELHLI